VNSTPVLILPADLQTPMQSAPTAVIDTRVANAAGYPSGAVNLRKIFTYLANSTADGLHKLKANSAKSLGDGCFSGAESAEFFETAPNTRFARTNA
jgi:thiosulfate/3-mercaptopyruvate sulfurtransferase